MGWRCSFPLFASVSLVFGLSSCGTGVDGDGGLESDAGIRTDGSTGDARAGDAGLLDAGFVTDGGGMDGGGLDGGTSVDAGREWPSGCLTCHGSGVSPAPPLDTRGNMDTTNRGIGAHRSHLEGDATWHREVVCEDCHTVPTSVLDPGHSDTPLPAEMT